MKSIDCLNNLCKHCEKITIRNGFIGCPYRCISNDFCEDYEIIMNDLKLLEELKKGGVNNANLKRRNQKNKER